MTRIVIELPPPVNTNIYIDNIKHSVTMRSSIKQRGKRTMKTNNLNTDNNNTTNNSPKYVKGEAPQFDETLLNKVWNEATSMNTDQLIAKIQKLHTAVAKKNKGWHRAEKTLPVWKFVADKSGVEWEGEDDKAFQQAVDAEVILAQQYSKKK